MAADMRDAEVTVIVPAYNAGRWLECCLDSVAGQTAACWRVVVADDGSTDSTAAIAERYASADARFSLLRLPHGGVSAARNAALGVASTEWVLFLDADDALHPQALELMFGAASSSAVGMVVAAQSYTGEVPAVMPPVETAARSARLLTADAALRMLLLRRGIEASMSGRLYRRNLFEEPCQLRFRDCRYEDLDLGYRVMERAGSVALLPCPLYYYRRHDDSFMRGFSRARFDVLDVADRMAAHFAATPLEAAAADRRFGAHCNVLLMMYSYRRVDAAVERRCLDVIRSLRTASLTGRGIRLKNRLGALASYGGRPLLHLISMLMPQR